MFVSFFLNSGVIIDSSAPIEIQTYTKQRTYLSAKIIILYRLQYLIENIV